MVDEDLRTRSERAEAALRRVVELAHDMRTWCSPHGVALGYADRLAEAIVGAPGLQKPGEAIAALADLEHALGQASDKWRDLTVQTEQQFVHAQQLLGEVLARFTRHGDPGEPSLTTGWIPERVVTGWREQHLALWRGAPDTEPEATAPAAPLDLERTAMTHGSTPEALTVHEHNAMELTADLWNLICQSIAQDGPSRSGDLRELSTHIHAIQHAILSQAAARSYPDRYRLMGGPPAGTVTVRENIGG